MRILLTMAVLLAVVSMALVAVCQHSETRRLQYRVWQLERRRERIERTRHRISMAIEANRTPRRLLCERDGRPLKPAASITEDGAAGLPPSASGPRWLFNTVQGDER